MLCEKGHNNIDDAKFCSMCGSAEFLAPPASGVVSTTGSTNGLAIASMILGIVWLYWIGSLLALIFGYISRRQIKQSGEKGAGFAVAGIVLGWVGVGFLVIAIFAVIAASNQTTSY